MKKYLAPMMIGLLSSSAVLAAVPGGYNGVVYFKGGLNATTCTVQAGSDAGGAEQTVKLPRVAASTLANEGDVAGTTPFTINLVGCDETATKARAFFTDAKNSSAGYVEANEEGYKDKVVFQLLENNGTAIDLTLDRGSQTALQDIVQNDGNGAGNPPNTAPNKLRYKVRYLSLTGDAKTAGEMTGAVNYSIDYQ